MILNHMKEKDKRMTVQIIDDLLPQVFQRELIESIHTIPWFFETDVARNPEAEGGTYPYHPDIQEKNYGFFHVPFWSGDNKPPTDPEHKEGATMAWNVIEPISYFLSEKFGFVYKHVIRCRMGFHVPVVGAIAGHFNAPHIDQAMVDPAMTLTALYYPFDSDGDTIIFNENHKDGTPESVTVKERITPKANRALLLDGGQYHASSFPIQTTQRVTINFNYII